ncbi:MAG: hypothetical protein J5I92_17630 [Thiogranum sp.]|nr:hypothetical protein [Thiogranum sp.]
MVHYEDTIRKKVEPERIYRYVSSALKQRLDGIFSGRPIAVWGSNASTANRAKFERMQPGDDILIVEGPTIKLLGKIAATTTNRDLSDELWKSLRGDTTQRWELIYFIANPQEINLPFAEFSKLMGYSENYQLRGFTTVAQDKLEAFYQHYDDLYSVLTLRKEARPVYEIPQHDLFGEDIATPDEPAELPREDPAEIPDNIVSDHLRMQWMLANLGAKAGNKVWIPAGDQGRLRNQFHFENFETEFAAGLDTQTRYVENIDVVWKDEFRIDAAFEIENSTAIYSGLLRFSDLTLVAPNTVYPLFIVAPREKRNRLVEQLRRPTFQKLRLDRKVRYLPYEEVERINSFFEGRQRGMNIDVILGGSEEIHFHH